MKLNIIKYLIMCVFAYQGLAIADAWRCPSNPGRFFETRESAAYSCGQRAYFTISADASAQRQSSLNMGGEPRGIYTARSHTQSQLTPPQPIGTAKAIRPYTSNFPYAGISNYSDFSAGAGLGDW